MEASSVSEGQFRNNKAGGMTEASESPPTVTRPHPLISHLISTMVSKTCTGAGETGYPHVDE